MTRAEIDQLFDFLAELYDNPKKLQRPNAKAAWYLALQPYSYDAVKGKLMDWYRGPRRKFIPDAKDLVPEEATQSHEEAPEAAQPPYTAAEVDRAYLQALWAFSGHTGLVPKDWEAPACLT